MLDFKVENADGNTVTYTPDEILNQLKQSGEAPKGFSPDGLSVILTDSKGDFEVKTTDLFKDLGWKVNAIEPQNPIEDSVKPELRVAVANLGNDDEIKKLYLQEKLQEMGLKNPNVVGQGTDFYVFHPETNQYFALTNKRGMDMSDIASGISQAPGFIGGAAAGAAGALGGLGVASIPAAAAAGALGQAAGDVASRGLLGLYDPTFRKVATANLGEQVKDIGGNAMISGATGGLFKALPMAAGALRGANSTAPRAVQGMLENGPLSSLARGAGRAAEETGRIASTVSAPFRQPGMAADIATSQIPVASQMQLGGMAMQAPGGLARVVGQMFEKYGPARAKQILAGVPKDATGKASLPDLMEALGRYTGESRGLNASQIASYKQARRAGVAAEEAVKSARMDRAVDYGNVGRSVGEKLGRASEYGTKLDDLASGITRTAADTAYVGGRATQGTGAALNRLGRAAAPYENRFYAKQGLEETLRPQLDPQFEDYLRQQRNKLQSQKTNLVYNPY